MEQFDIAHAERHFAVTPPVPRGADLGIRISLMSGALLGDLRYQQGHLIEAEQLLRASTTLHRQGGMTDFLLATYGTGARLATVLGDLAEAERLLTIGAQIAEERSFPGWSPESSMNAYERTFRFRMTSAYGSPPLLPTAYRTPEPTP